MGDQRKPAKREALFHERLAIDAHVEEAWVDTSDDIVRIGGTGRVVAAVCEGQHLLASGGWHERWLRELAAEGAKILEGILCEFGGAAELDQLLPGEERLIGLPIPCGIGDFAESGLITEDIVEIIARGGGVEGEVFGKIPLWLSRGVVPPPDDVVDLRLGQSEHREVGIGKRGFRAGLLGCAIRWKSRDIDVEQPTFVVDGEGIAPDDGR